MHIIINPGDKTDSKTHYDQDRPLPTLQEPHRTVHKHYDELVCNIHLDNLHDNISGTCIFMSSCKPIFLAYRSRRL